MTKMWCVRLTIPLLLATVLLAACGSDSVPAPEPAPGGLLAVAAGGAIYTVQADGSDLQQVVPGGRGGVSTWASAPSLSQDSTHLLFTRDLDIWIAPIPAEGPPSFLIDAGEQRPSPGASNFSLGAQSVERSPDQQHMLYTLGRVGGSGLSEVWITNDRGASGQKIFDSGFFIAASWSADGDVLIQEGRSVLRLSPPTWEPESSPLPSGALESPLVVTESDGVWLIGEFINEGLILFGPADALIQIAIGVSPVISPDRNWVAYFARDELRIVRVDGSVDRRVVDLVPFGGRDRHFASGCFGAPACSYRIPIVSWAALPGP